MNRALVQYVFNGPPHPIIQKPHGNSKEAKPFIRTSPSTLQKLKECSKTSTVKRTIYAITKEKGGIVDAKAVGDLPRDRKQVYNIQNRDNPQSSDALLSVMAMCKESFGKESEQFVRIVTSAPEPMCILCTDSQLFDVERFCTGSGNFCPLTIDPTFDLGDFSVTVTCYRHLLLQNHQNAAKSPVIVGPMLVHRRKCFSSYHFLASSLVSLRPGISQLRAYGTDGEEALYKAFSAQFQEATHVRCFLHFRDNCKAKLHEIGVTNDILHDILQDILGSFLKGKKGLVDSVDTNEFLHVLQGFKEKWNLTAPGFFDWFFEHKAPTVQSSMIRPVRESAGLGNPPEPFYTNDIESMNRIIKQKTNYKACEWPEFCKLAQELIKEQESEIEKAVICVGEYRFKEKYGHLRVPLHKWSSMSACQRQRHLKKIATMSMNEMEGDQLNWSSLNTTGERMPSNAPVLKICSSEFNVKGLKLPIDILSNMFSKAERLVTGSSCIVSAPGTSTAKLVESRSNQRPHYITRKGLHKYCCDTDCPMWKCSKICAHTIASAFTDNNLQQFLSGCGSEPNLYALAKSNTKTNAGKKPARRKALTKSASKAITLMRQELSSIKIPPSVTEPASSCNTASISVVQSPHINPPSPANNSGSISMMQSPRIGHTPSPANNTGRTPSSSMVQSPCIGHTPSPAVGTNISVVQSPHIGYTPSPAGGTPIISVVQSPRIGHTPGRTPSISVVQSPCISHIPSPAGGPSTNMVQSPCIGHTPSPAVVQSPHIGHTPSPAGGTPIISVVQSPRIGHTPPSISVVQSPHISHTTSPAGGTPSTSTNMVQSPCVGHTPSPAGGTPISMVHSPHIGHTSSPAGTPTPSISMVQSPQINTGLCANVLAGLLKQIVSSPDKASQVLVQPIPQIVSNNLFWIMFLMGNISRCQGCGGKIERGMDGKVLPPPGDLVIQHKEQVVFQNPHSGKFQLSRDYRNVYYHPRLSCLQRKFPQFKAVEHIRTSNEVFKRLTLAHRSYIKKEFSIELHEK